MSCVPTTVTLRIDRAARGAALAALLTLGAACGGGSGGSTAATEPEVVVPDRLDQAAAATAAEAATLQRDDLEGVDRHEPWELEGDGDGAPTTDVDETLIARRAGVCLDELSELGALEVSTSAPYDGTDEGDGQFIASLSAVGVTLAFADVAAAQQALESFDDAWLSDCLVASSERHYEQLDEEREAFFEEGWDESDFNSEYGVPMDADDIDVVHGSEPNGDDAVALLATYNSFDGALDDNHNAVTVHAARRGPVVAFLLTTRFGEDQGSDPVQEETQGAAEAVDAMLARAF